MLEVALAYLSETDADEVLARLGEAIGKPTRTASPPAATRFPPQSTDRW